MKISVLIINSCKCVVLFMLLLVAMIMTEVTPGKLERSSGGGVDAVVDLGDAC